MPTDSSIFVRSWPARPTKGRPWRSSSSPGPSPMIRSRAAGSPEPKTIVVRPWESLHFVQPALAVSTRRRAAAGPPRWSFTSGRSRSPRAWWTRRCSARARAASASASAAPTSGLLGRARRAAQLLDPVQDEVGHLDLRAGRRRHDPAPAVEQHNLVVGHVEADVGPAYVVRDNKVHPLGHELLARVLAELVSFRGEPDEEATALPGAELPQDIRRR